VARKSERREVTSMIGRTRDRRSYWGRRGRKRIPGVAALLIPGFIGYSPRGNCWRHMSRWSAQQGDETMREDERCPVFHQFVDCLWQIIRQYPTHFQYNEAFLIALSNNVYSCQFGTFFCNNDKEREEKGVKRGTISLWSYLNSNAVEFLNPFYLEKEAGVITKVSSVQNLQLWTSYFLRWRPDLSNNQTEAMTQVLLDSQEQANQKIKLLEKQVAEMKREIHNLQSQSWVPSKPSSLVSPK